MDARLWLRLIIIGGITLLTMLVVQMLIGYRRIHFKGPLHMKIHRALGWLIVLSGIAHGSAAMIIVGGL